MSASMTSAADQEQARIKERARREARQEVRVVSAKQSVNTRVRDIWAYRQLLLSLIRKELKVKYKDSILGFAWSMLNPAFTLTMYYVVFQVILKNGIPMFAVYLLSGLLVWNLFSTALAGATGSVTGNGSIVKKVSFPREVLPLASVGASMFNFLLQGVVMILALAVFRHSPDFAYFPMFVLAYLILCLFTAALAVFLAAVNVTFRDTQHLLEIVLMFWFWMTPIVYAFAGTVQNGIKAHSLQWIYFLNPVTPVVLVFQKFFYNMIAPTTKTNGNVVQLHVLTDAPSSWYLWHLGIVAAVAVVLLYGALVVFGRLEGNFAEEL